MSKKIFIALILIFISLSIVAFKNALPQKKNKEVMNLLTQYIPYKLEKRLGGLNIVNTKTKEIEKPSNEMVFKRLDELEKEWGKKHLKVVTNKLYIVDNNKTVKVFTIGKKENLEFIHKFFGI